MATLIEIGPESENVHNILLAQLTRLDGAIEKEFTLVSDRMVWMVISESFIFGAFTAAVVNYDPRMSLRYVILALIGGLPIVGMLIAELARRAIKAAHTSAETLKGQREPLEKMFLKPLQVTLISSKLPAHATGNLPPKVLPPVIIAAWTVFLAVALFQLMPTPQ